MIMKGQKKNDNKIVLNNFINYMGIGPKQYKQSLKGLLINSFWIKLNIFVKALTDWISALAGAKICTTFSKSSSSRKNVIGKFQMIF